MSLVVGLGNPGERYWATRHNVGFRTADRLLERAGGRWEAAPGGEGLAARAALAGRPVWLAKPHTYMNESGRMAAALARYYRIAPQAVLVVSDDIELALGRLRIRPKGSSGGQRGLASVLEHFGTTEVPRLRLGVGPRPARSDAAGFVLSRFRAEETEEAEAMVARAAEAAEVVVTKGVAAAMNLYNAASA